MDPTVKGTRLPTTSFNPLTACAIRRLRWTATQIQIAISGRWDVTRVTHFVTSQYWNALKCSRFRRFRRLESLMSRCVWVCVCARCVHTVMQRLVSLDKAACLTAAPPALTDPRRL